MASCTPVPPSDPGTSSKYMPPSDPTAAAAKPGLPPASDPTAAAAADGAKITQDAQGSLIKVSIGRHQYEVRLAPNTPDAAAALKAICVLFNKNIQDPKSKFQSMLEDVATQAKDSTCTISFKDPSKLTVFAQNRSGITMEWKEGSWQRSAKKVNDLATGGSGDDASGVAVTARRVGGAGDDKDGARIDDKGVIIVRIKDKKYAISLKSDTLKTMGHDKAKALKESICGAFNSTAQRAPEKLGDVLAQAKGDPNVDVVEIEIGGGSPPPGTRTRAGSEEAEPESRRSSYSSHSDSGSDSDYDVTDPEMEEEDEPFDSSRDYTEIQQTPQPKQGVFERIKNFFRRAKEDED